MIDFNTSSDEVIQENKARKPVDYLERPDDIKCLKRALDAFEERQLKRQLAKELNTGNW